MKEDFLQILEEHARRYPLMQPQDVGKLIFQSEYGAEHFAGTKEKMLSFIRKELSAVSKDASPQMPESVGGGFCRFPLSVLTSDKEEELLADLFLLTAEKCCGTKEGVFGKLRQAEQLKISGMEAWAREWKEKSCPAVSHSDTYRNAYHPHYRLLCRDYAGYFPALSKIFRLAEQGRPAVIAIDGRCGSGKSHFAGLISRLFVCNVIHMDDFYLPLAMRKENWQEVPGGNMDFQRIQKEVLYPIREGKTAICRPYDCGKGEISGLFQMPERKLTIVEGSYSQHPSLQTAYDLKLFFTCSREEQERRLRLREGNCFSMFEKRWMPMEENYFSRCKTREESDLVVDTSCFVLPQS